MKIAILFNGHLRTFRDNTTIENHLIRQYPDADVFCQTFQVRNLAGNKWHTDEGGAGEPVTDDDIDYLGKWQPVATEVSPINSGADALPTHLAGVGFRWSKQRVCEMRQRYERAAGIKYDVVFIARYDLGLREPFVFPDKIEPDTLYGGYNRNQEQNGCDGDVFLYGTPEVIDACMIPAVPHELDALAFSVGFHGERLVTEARKLRGYKYAAHRTPHFLYRTGGGQMDVWQ